jgi:hypothetical protein
MMIMDRKWDEYHASGVGVQIGQSVVCVTLTRRPPDTRHAA